MSCLIPDSATEYGFRIKQGGAHSSKTMMLREMRLLFAASTPDTDFTELRRLTVEENVLLKATLSNRAEVWRRLTELYALKQELPLYRALRALWDSSESEQPMLALLCALARDPLLRATAPAVLEQPVCAVVSAQLLEDAVEAAFPQRYSSKTRLSISQNTTATWAQSGHLVGKLKKVRQHPVVGPAAAAFALLLAYLCDARGTLLFDTCWVEALDIDTGGIDSLAFAASRHGWLDYRRIGSVADIGFSHLLQI